MTRCNQRYIPAVVRTSMAAALLAIAGQVTAADWPQWGRDASKNMVSPDNRGIVVDFHPGQSKGRSDEIDMSTTRHVRWIAKLGSNSYGNVTVANGRVYVGTNNAMPRNPYLKGDRSNVYCLDETTGKLLWQFSAPKLGAGKVGDWEYLGICSSPSVDGNRVYVVTNRCEVLCLDVDALANGNDGPYTEEGVYLAGRGKAPLAVGEQDADIIWRFDMAGELGVFPHNVTSSSVLVVGERIYATTSNGVDYSHKHIINPRAPSLIVLDKHTGELIGEEASAISTRIFHANWSSPSSGVIRGRRKIFFGAGDGFCYAFDADPKVDEDGLGILEETWRFDCNPYDYKFKNGEPAVYNTPAGPSEIIATPVFHDDRVYIATGQDPEHGEGAGALSCIDATKTGDISKSALMWQNTKIGRSISTVAVATGLLYAADYAGIVYCLDADNGQILWSHDTLGHIWGSPLATDAHVFVGNEDGILTILKTGRHKQVVAEIEFIGPIYSSPVIANGTLYVGTMSHLYAIGK